jgi:hypothetical protein
VLAAGNHHHASLHRFCARSQRRIQETVNERKEEIELLVCKCKSCTHWEIGKDLLICKTCGLTLPAKITVDDSHHMLHWEKHER